MSDVEPLDPGSYRDLVRRALADFDMGRVAGQLEALDADA